MFDLFSWSHIVILLVVALVVVGPKDLPRLMHMAGKWAGKARAMANEFRKSFDEMARQAELDELRKEIEDLKKNNPVSDIANSVSEMQAAINEPAADVANSMAEVQAAITEGAGQTPAQTTAPVEGSVEPRSGELEVTDTAATAPSHGPAAP
jgi:sec-independent protein translocase protein TatB